MLIDGSSFLLEADGLVPSFARASRRWIMPRALALPVRQQIVLRHQQGETLKQIAVSEGIAYRTVLGCWRRYRDQGEQGLAIHYDRCGPQGPEFPEEQIEAALALKRAHPRWGAGLIRLQLKEQFPAQPLAAERTLQTWFRQAGLQPVKAVQPPVDKQRAKQTHAVWQIDAKERMHLADGSPTSVLTVTDEASGALLGVMPFPPLALDASGRPRRSREPKKPV
jgi:transposase